MAAIMNNFSNQEIDIASLPQYEAVDFHPISRQYLKKSLVELVISLCFLIIGLGFFIYFQPLPLLNYAAILFLVLFFAFKIWNVFKMQEKYGYSLREKDIIYTRGFILSRTTVVPFNRIQHATISRGVLDKFFGIATLNIFTAGGSGSDIKIPGLEPDLAARLKESLAKKISEDEF
jgi:membrane protein YdbS with pleckstrin-like domain